MLNDLNTMNSLGDIPSLPSMEFNLRGVEVVGEDPARMLIAAYLLYTDISTIDEARSFINKTAPSLISTLDDVISKLVETNCLSVTNNNEINKNIHLSIINNNPSILLKFLSDIYKTQSDKALKDFANGVGKELTELNYYRLYNVSQKTAEVIKMKIQQVTAEIDQLIENDPDEASDEIYFYGVIVNETNLKDYE